MASWQALTHAAGVGTPLGLADGPCAAAARDGYVHGAGQRLGLPSRRSPHVGLAVAVVFHWAQGRGMMHPGPWRASLGDVLPVL